MATPHESPATEQAPSALALRVGDVAGRVLAAPVLLVHAVVASMLGRTAAFRSTSEAIALVPGPLGLLLRRHVYRATLARCGRDVSIGFGTVLTYPDAELGDGVYIGRFCAIALATIGDGTMLGDQVRVISGRHGMEPGRKMREQPLTVERVAIGRDAWLATGVTVLADVGAEAVVAAGAVVTRPVAAGAMVGGVPARVLREPGA